MGTLNVGIVCIPFSLSCGQLWEVAWLFNKDFLDWCIKTLPAVTLKLSQKETEAALKC